MEQPRQVRTVNLSVHVCLREAEVPLKSEAEPEDGVLDGESRCSRSRVLRPTLSGKGEVMALAKEC